MDHLNRYIQQAREHGQTDKEIHADLIDAGWDKEQIEHGLTKPQVPRPPSANKDHSVDHGEDQEPTQPVPHWVGGFYAIDHAIKAIRRNANPAIFYIAVVAIVNITSNLLINKSLTTSPAHVLERAIISGGVALIFLPFSICYPLALAKGIKVTIDELLHSSFKQYFNLIIAFISPWHSL